jgi:VanZ family protein
MDNFPPVVPHSSSVSIRQVWIFGGIALILAVIYLSLTPRPVTIPGGQGDKFSHTLAYLVLMLWFVQVYVSTRSKLISAVLFILMGVGIEYVQLWIGIRTFEWLDMASGAAGVLLGLIMAPPRMPNLYRWIEARLATT